MCAFSLFQLLDKCGYPLAVHHPWPCHGGAGGEYGFKSTFNSIISCWNFCENVSMYYLAFVL